MADNAEFKKRIESEARAAMPIRNENLVCYNCTFRFDDSKIPGNTSKCEVYDYKPNHVLNGEMCMYHTPEEVERYDNQE